MKKGIAFFLKGKKPYIYRKGFPVYFPSVFELIKKYPADFYHIIDKDLERGLISNYDLYDALTYNYHIQVEPVKNEKFAEKLLEINVRVVLFPGTLHLLEKYNERRAFLPVKLEKIDERLRYAKDIIVEEKNMALLEKLPKKDERYRVFFFNCKPTKKLPSHCIEFAEISFVE